MLTGCRWSEVLNLRWRDIGGDALNLADAKLGGLRLHDLRHTAASQAVMADANLPLVGKLLGHRRHRTTAGYANLSDALLLEAVETVGTIIDTAMTPNLK